MKQLPEIVASHWRALGSRWQLPERRQIELYTKKRRLSFSDEGPGTLAESALPDTLGTRVALMLLESHLDASDPELHEGKASWEKYLALPRQSTTDKLVAEIFRILRLLRIATTHAQGIFESCNGLVHAKCTFKGHVLILNITPAGLALIESFVHCFLDALHQPYGERYVEVLLTRYYMDIIDEVHKFTDENRSLYQFNPKIPNFNRHFRFDCDNPRFQISADHFEFEVSDSYRDPAYFPIDFFLPLNDSFYIVPSEAMLPGHRLPTAELALWQARTTGSQLPANFRMRFGRETMPSRVPMT